MIKEQIETIYKTYKDDFSGACLLTKGSDIIFQEAAGLANRDFKVANRIDTRFDTASITKVFTAVAILQLIERKLLKLDEKIHDIIDLSGTEIPSDVRIEHLLNHTSGIADDADEEAGEDYSALFINKPNYSIRNCADFLPQFAYKQPVFKAGTNVRYNNCAFILLGMVIEQLTGMDYRSYVTKHVFKTAGMERTYFGAKDEVCLETAEGYYAQRDENNSFVMWKKNIYSYPPVGTADSGALTTVGDLYKLVRALVCGELLSNDSTKLMLTPHCGFLRQNSFGKWRTGYGFEFLETNDKIFCMYKEGVNPGVTAICSYYPTLDICLCMLANQDGPFWKMHKEFQSIIYAIFCEQTIHPSFP